MNTVSITTWIRKLGDSYDDLIVQGLIGDAVLRELYPGRDLLDMDPQAGLNLCFWAKTKRLETLFVTLKSTMPEIEEYLGGLPEPYRREMTQSDVHDHFGEPSESKGPIKMPEPMGQTGGWESYLLDSDMYPGKKVVFQYTATMEVKTLVFTLIDKGHD